MSSQMVGSLEFRCSACQTSVARYQKCDLCRQPMCKNCQIYGYSNDVPVLAYHRFCINKPENPETGEMMERKYVCSVCKQPGDGSTLRGCNADGCANAVHLTCGAKSMWVNGTEVVGCPDCLTTCQ
jgi:hypothetical protein